MTQRTRVRSGGLRETLSQVEAVAPTNTTVLLSGETGTGKEVTASGKLPAFGHSNPRTVQEAPVFSLFANGTLLA